MSDTVTRMFLLDPARETPKAWCISNSSTYLPKSVCNIAPLIEDGKHVSVRLRVRKYLHPKASRLQRHAYERGACWKLDANGEPITVEVFFYRVTMPAWFAKKNDFVAERPERSMETIAKVARKLMEDEVAA